MPKAKSKSFFCRECGAKSPKWNGKCLTCGAWSSMEEEAASEPASEKRGLSTSGRPTLLKDVDISSSVRLKTGLEEFDRVLGGGIVKGSLVLLGGDPGIGKSTLILQVMITLSTAGVPCLYVSGEESLQQIKIRSQRLNLPHPDLPVMSETSLTAILEQAEKLKPKVIVIDSIQTVYKEELPGAPGAEMQLREATLALMIYAKSHDCAVFIIGHVTKGGVIAGPRLIEHMVDTVIYFEGDRHYVYRILRAVKNRFGATSEIGVFEMAAQGLLPVKNPSTVFIENAARENPGSIITCSMEGSRPILVEVQALVNRSSYANAQRVSMGFDSKRLTIILALLEKFAGVQVGLQDVFISIAGGYRISEPSADLAIAAAVASNHLTKSPIAGTLVMGELGLGGELRMISLLELRIKEAIRLGFNRIIIPQSSKRFSVKGDIIQVKRLQDALEKVYD